MFVPCPLINSLSTTSTPRGHREPMFVPCPLINSLSTTTPVGTERSNLRVFFMFGKVIQAAIIVPIPSYPSHDRFLPLIRDSSRLVMRESFLDRMPFFEQFKLLPAISRHVSNFMLQQCFQFLLVSLSFHELSLQL